MDPDKAEIIKNKIIEFLSHMGFEAQVFERQEEGRTVFNIKTFDAQLLIGKQGANLEALQYLVFILAGRVLGEERLPFALDVDDYKEKRVIFLKEIARKAAHQVRERGRSVILPAMPSYERRVIHNYLSLFADLVSESTGEEGERRVIIKQKKHPASETDEFKFIENT